MRSTAFRFGSGETNSFHSLATMNCAVSRRARIRSMTPSPSKRPLAEDRLFAVVVQSRAERERAGLAIDAPAGECARRFLDVLFAVVALSQREKLHHFTREILVRRAFAVLRVVEIDDHRGILRHRVQKGREAAHRVCAKHRVLREHQPRIAHLLLARNEMVVPEQRHSFGERRRRDEHFANPPSAQFVGAARFPALKRLAFLGARHWPGAAPRVGIVEPRRWRRRR